MEEAEEAAENETENEKEEEKALTVKSQGNAAKDHVDEENYDDDEEEDVGEK